MQRGKPEQPQVLLRKLFNQLGTTFIKVRWSRTLAMQHVLRAEPAVPDCARCNDAAGTVHSKQPHAVPLGIRG